MYETFAHTADLGLRVRADSLEALFADAGRGLASMLAANVDPVETRRTLSIELAADDLEYLLFDWLNELLYQFEAEGLLLADFTVSVTADNDECRLAATCRGEPADPLRHDLAHEVKAITYHGLTVQQENGQWLAEVIVDI